MNMVIHQKIFLKENLPCDLAITLLGINSRESKSPFQRHIGANMFAAALLTTAMIQNQLDPTRGFITKGSVVHMYNRIFI